MQRLVFALLILLIHGFMVRRLGYKIKTNLMHYRRSVVGQKIQQRRPLEHQQGQRWVCFDFIHYLSKYHLNTF